MPSDIKFLGIDLDGTLLKTNKRIATDSYASLDEFSQRNENCVFAVITGRSFGSTKPYCEQVNNNCQSCRIKYVGCFNGALLYKIDVAGDFNTIHKNLIPDTAGELLYNLIIRHKVFFWGYPEFLYKGAPILVSRHPIGKIIQIARWKDMYYLRNYVHSNYFKINVLSLYKKRLDAFHDELLTKYGHLFECARVSEKLIEITAKGITKGTVVAKICDFENVAFEQRCAIGDSHNDLPMFNAVKWKIATRGAATEIKEIATYVGTKTNNKQFSCVFDDYLLNAN